MVFFLKPHVGIFASRLTGPFQHTVTRAALGLSLQAVLLPFTSARVPKVPEQKGAAGPHGEEQVASQSPGVTGGQEQAPHPAPDPALCLQARRVCTGHSHVHALYFYV